jgi:DUF4097 and DUF4098 domain-containing protein YvlB
MFVRPALVASFGLTLVLPALAQDRNIDKVNGRITVEAGERYGQLETVNGSIQVGARAQTGNVETVNGSIRVDERARTGSLETVNGAIRVAAGTAVAGNVETVNGGVFIDRGSEVRSSIETVNGSIGLVDTDVGGGIETVNGDVTVGVGSHVRGGLRVAKSTQWIGIGMQRAPRVVIGPDARVDGPLVFEREVTLYVHDTARTGAISGAQAIRFSTPTPPAR